MGIIYWRADAEHAYMINNMQGIALETDVWEAYIACQSKGREVFKQCAADEYEWSFHTVIAYANYEDNPPLTPEIEPPPTVKSITVKPVTVKIDARGDNEDTNATDFKFWMFSVKAATDSDKSLSYVYGQRGIMNDGTVTVSVALKRGANFLKRVSFVFHYHPGSKGAVVGGAAGSKWHFKPFDKAKKWVRVEEYDFVKLDPTMVKNVKEIVKRKPK